LSILNIIEIFAHFLRQYTPRVHVLHNLKFWPALSRPTQPLIQWIRRPFPRNEADHSRPSSAEVKSAWSYTSASSIRFHSVVFN